jgi:hypothetical protein
MTTPILHPGDQIHLAVPVSVGDPMIESLKADYSDRGVTVFRISSLTGPDIEIVSIIRAVQHPGPMDVMTAFGHLGPGH